MNLVGEKINTDEAKCRPFDVKELHGAIAGTGAIRMSWGFNRPFSIEDTGYRFNVQGHHHRGYVYIFLNGMDLFDIYYTSTQNNIKKVRNDIYIDQLIEILDTDIEKIPEYTS